MSKFFPLYFFIVLIIGACNVIKIDRPAENYNYTSYAPRNSHISIPFETDAGTLKKIVNREIPGLLYSDTSFDNNDHDNLMLRATRSDSITIAIDRNQISYLVPLKIWIRKRITAGLLGYSFSSDQDASAEIALKFKTTVSLNKDWSVNAITVSDGYEWISYPQVMVGLLQIKLPIIGDLVLKSNMSTITREIDKSIRSSFNLKPIVAGAWTGMQSPILISEEYSLWLKLTPLEISSVPIKGSSNSLRHIIGISALVQLYYGSEPVNDINPTMPPLKITSSISDQFSINFSLDIPFTQINELARKQFIGYIYTYKNHKIIVSDINIYGQGESLIVSMKVEGSVKGTIYLTGLPVFKSETNTIELKNLDFSINTKNVLVKTGSWIFHSGLVQKMSASLVFPVGAQLLEARNEVSSYFHRNQSLSYFRISGEVNKLEPDKILISPESVKAYFQLDGNMKVKVIGE